LSSWLSDQASPARTQDLLEGKLKSLKAQVDNGDVSMPEFWGAIGLYQKVLNFGKVVKTELTIDLLAF
jgi:pyridoxine/pyridoxamine 5'-phosphate oxidase